MNKTKFQVFIEDFILTCLSILKIFLLSNLFLKRIKKKPEDKSDCIILANGPSLKESIENNKDFLNDKDLICVNYFPQTDLYEELKPRYYITAAPELWREDMLDEFLERKDKLYKTIAKKTNWELTIFIPFLAKRYEVWKSHLINNSNINIVYFNSTPVEGFKWFRHICYKNNWAIQRPWNVLIPSILLAINKNYRQIYLLGADHSWLPNLTVDDNNQVLFNQKHFYDINVSKASVLKSGHGEKRTVHYILRKWFLAFHGYFFLNDYAKSKGVEILNATPGSFIDAFDRIKL